MGTGTLVVLPYQREYPRRLLIDECLDPLLEGTGRRGGKRRRRADLRLDTIMKITNILRRNSSLLAFDLIPFAVNGEPGPPD
ncbi:hypothetical protein UA75_13480 [Actinoalloteichus sp. GBA129-24]|nr:hypothetical protein UA75_13480 [Actinoalloteichus sp. GBA129-24]